MAEIGKRAGVAELFGFKLHGFIAWWLWRTFYLSNLPSLKKKLKVMGDWTMDLIYKPDVAMVKRYNKDFHDNAAQGHSMKKESAINGAKVSHDKMQFSKLTAIDMVQNKDYG